MSTLRIFISYSHSDDEYTDKFARALHDAGADVWYDRQTMGAGEWLIEVTRQLHDCSVFALVLTKAALGSNWVDLELHKALELQLHEPERVILPVVAEPLAPLDLPAYLRDYRSIEAPGHQPYKPEEAARHMLDTLGLRYANEESVSAMPAMPYVPLPFPLFPRRLRLIIPWPGMRQVAPPKVRKARSPKERKIRMDREDRRWHAAMKSGAPLKLDELIAQAKAQIQNGEVHDLDMLP